MEVILVGRPRDKNKGTKIKMERKIKFKMEDGTEVKLKEKIKIKMKKKKSDANPDEYWVPSKAVSMMQDEPRARDLINDSDRAKQIDK